VSEFAYIYVILGENMKDSRCLSDTAAFSCLDVLVKKLVTLGKNFVTTRDILQYSNEEKMCNTLSKD
jgi:hypothetical protein